VRFALLKAGEYRYGSAGIWQSCVEGDLGITPICDWSGFRVLMLDPQARYEGFWFDPASARRFALTTVTGEANCSTPSVPSPQDWVLVLLRR
jgi:hypothetical protein